MAAEICTRPRSLHRFHRRETLQAVVLLRHTRQGRPTGHNFESSAAAAAMVTEVASAPAEATAAGMAAAEVDAAAAGKWAADWADALAATTAAAAMATSRLFAHSPSNRDLMHTAPSSNSHLRPRIAHSARGQCIHRSWCLPGVACNRPYSEIDQVKRVATEATGMDRGTKAEAAVLGRQAAETGAVETGVVAGASAGPVFHLRARTRPQPQFHRGLKGDEKDLVRLAPEIRQN